MGKQIRTTVIGGLVFVVPLIFVILLLQRAYDYALKVARPISNLVPIENLAGVALANVLAVLIVVALSYAAGMMARTSLISSRVEKLDDFLTRAFPAYHSTKKGFVDTVENNVPEDGWQPVMVGKAGDKKWLGFEVERLPEGGVVVFQPLTPNTKTGFVWTVPADQVDQIKMEPRQLSLILRGYGIGVSSSVDHNQI